MKLYSSILGILVVLAGQALNDQFLVKQAYQYGYNDNPLPIATLAGVRSTLQSPVITGKVSIRTGNCMPTIGNFKSSCKISGFATTVYISKLTSIYREELLIKQVATNKNGEFYIDLPEGQYSIFTDYNGHKYSGFMNQIGANVYCSPAIIKSNQITKMNITVNQAIW